MQRIGREVLGVPPRVEDEDVQAYLDELKIYRSRREPYALLLDSAKSWGFNARQRQMQAEYIASGIEITRQFLKAFAFVAHSSLQRGMVTAVFWIKPPESPHKIFASVEEAEAWIRQRLPNIPTS